MDGLCPVCEQNKNRKNPLRWMQDVSFEPLMLCLSENPQASLDIFSQLHHHPAGSLHPSQGDKQEKNILSCMWKSHKHNPAAYCPPGRVWWCVIYPRALPPVTYSSALQAPERIWRPSVVVKNPEDECLSLFIALRWMQRPERVMVWLTENV